MFSKLLTKSFLHQQTKINDDKIKKIMNFIKLLRLNGILLLSIKKITQHYQFTSHLKFMLNNLYISQ